MLILLLAMMTLDKMFFETVPVVILDDCVFHQVFSFDEHDAKDLFFLCTSTPNLFQKYDFVEKTKDY